MTEAAWFGGRLRELRESLNWTREVLSDRSGVPGPTIRDIERGENLPGWANVLAFAKALGVGVEAFAQEPTHREPPKMGRPKKIPLEPPAAGAEPAKRGRPRKQPEPAAEAKKPAGKKGGG